MFTLSKTSHRNIVTEAEHCITNITKKTHAKLIRNEIPLPGFSWWEWMQTKALWTDQNCGMVYEKHNGL